MRSFRRKPSLATIIGAAITGMTVVAALSVALSLYFSFDNRLTEEFRNGVRTRGHEVGLRISQELTMAKNRLAELTLDNSIRVTMMLDVDYQLEERLRTFHGQPAGAIFFVGHGDGGPIYSSGLASAEEMKLASSFMTGAAANNSIIRTTEGGFLIGYS